MISIAFLYMGYCLFKILVSNLNEVDKSSKIMQYLLKNSKYLNKIISKTSILWISFCYKKISKNYKDKEFLIKL